MKMRLILLLLPVVVLNCQQKADPCIELVDSNGTQIPKVNIEQIRNEKLMKFSDWFEDIHLIELEATDKSLIDQALNSYVGKNDIIVSTLRSGVLHFTSEGKFVKCLVKRGRGPGEIAEINPRFFVDESTHKAYFSVAQKSKILCVNIKTGDFDYIQLVNTGPEPFHDCPTVIDTVMYCATITFTGQRSTHPLFCQSTSGNLLWEIRKTAPINSPNARTFLVDDQIYFKYSRGDTLFRVKDGRIFPYLIIASSSPRATFPKAAENQVDYGISPLVGEWFIGYYSYIQNVDWENQREGFPKVQYSKRIRFLYNHQDQQLFRYGESFVNDYYASTESFNPTIQNNGIAFAKYQAIDLLELADSIMALDNVDPDVRNRLQFVIKNIDPESNPCMLIGNLKKSI